MWEGRHKRDAHTREDSLSFSVAWKGREGKYVCVSSQVSLKQRARPKISEVDPEERGPEEE